MQRIVITAPTGHFGEVLGRDDRKTLPVPPPSTIVGMLRLIYNKDIDNFIFGYTFQSGGAFIDDITIYKHNAGGVFRKKGSVVTDCRSIENHFDTKLTIYTDIEDDITLDFPICMGKSGNPARVHFPIQKVKFTDTEGQGFNQYTPKNIGRGVINATNLVTNYKKNIDSYEQQVEHLRFNKEFDYNRNYDSEMKQNIFLWRMESGRVIAND